MPDWAPVGSAAVRQRLALPTQPQEFGGRNATACQQYVYLEEDVQKRRIYHRSSRKA